MPSPYEMHQWLRAQEKNGSNFAHRYLRPYNPLHQVDPIDPVEEPGPFMWCPLCPVGSGVNDASRFGDIGESGL